MAEPNARDCEVCAFNKRKLAEVREELERVRKQNRVYARDNESLWSRFYENERTIKLLRGRNATRAALEHDEQREA